MSILARLYQVKLEKQGLADKLLLFMPYICLSSQLHLLDELGPSASY